MNMVIGARLTVVVDSFIMVDSGVTVESGSVNN